MILALDVHYKSDYAKAAAVSFSLNNNKVIEQYEAIVKNVKPYKPGKFYLRELPCLIEVLNKLNIKSFEAVIIDGHIYIDNERNFGLGAYLYKTLKENIPIIGVAKNAFKANEQTVKEVLRGKSVKPLYVSSIGMDLNDASDLILNLAGNFRFPTVLKELDRITKTS